MSEAEDAAAARDQQLSSQLEELNAENGKLREQLKELNSSVLDLRGKLEVSSTAQSMMEAREKQHEQQMQEQAGRIKEKAAELELLQKEVEVGAGMCS